MPIYSIIIKIIFSLLMLICVACGNEEEHVDTVSAVPPIDEALRQRIDSFVTAVPAIGDVGLIVYDLTADQEIYSLCSDSLMQPASCMKLFTTVAALRTLGPHALHKTELYTTGDIKQDTLHGNIILKVHFDPYFHADSLARLLTYLPPQIKGIKGHVVIDMNNQQPMLHEEHWTPGDLKTRYLSLSFTGYYKLARLLPYVMSQATGLRITPKDIIPGTFNPRKAHLCGTIYTPLAASVERSLRVSSNINAECLLYPLGYRINPHGNYRQGGIEFLRQFINRELLQPDEDPKRSYALHDGCGLCPESRVTPALLVNLLRYSWQHPYIYKTLLAFLPHSGIDGTLRDRLRKPHLVGRITAKTGTLTRDGGISTLAGYFKGNDGHTIAFAIMNNRCPVLDGRWWQDKLIEKAFLPKPKQQEKTISQSAVKKPDTKKTEIKKTTTKKTSTKKAKSAKKATTKETTPKKSSTTKSVTKKTTAPKNTPKKSSTKTSVTKKTTTKKTTTKKRRNK